MKQRVVIFHMDGVLFDTIPIAKELFLKGYPGMTDEMYDEIHTGNFYTEVKKYAHLKQEETEEEKMMRQSELSRPLMPYVNSLREFAGFCQNDPMDRLKEALKDVEEDEDRQDAMRQSFIVTLRLKRQTADHENGS